MAALQELRRLSTSSSVTELEAEGHTPADDAESAASGEEELVESDGFEAEEEEEVQIHDPLKSDDIPGPADSEGPGLKRLPHIDNVDTQPIEPVKGDALEHGLQSDDNKPCLKDCNR